MVNAPAVIIMTISATRMHRSLVDFASRPLDVYETLYLFSCVLSAANFGLGHT
jgi:hypothetical protein